MPKLVHWTEESAKKELSKRISYSKDVRSKMERDWKEAELTLFSTRAIPNASSYGAPLDSSDAVGIGAIDQGTTDVAINYVFKNYRYTCSQLAANPPAVLARPQSSDQTDKRKADAADRLVRYFRTEYQLQETIELSINNCQAYGTGIVKTVWDAEDGDPLEFNEETEEILMTGDFQITNISPWDFLIDPDASTWKEVKFVFERIMMPYEEAVYRFPDKIEVLKKNRRQEERGDQDLGANSELTKNYYDAVELYQYWEKGAPHNGYQGRMCWCSKDGTLLTEVMANPYKFSPPADKGLSPYGDKKELLARAYLPYHIFTDGDLPGQVWGKSTALYATPLQDLHNRLYNNVIDCVAAHGIPRLILPEGADISEESITNTPWDILRMKGQGQDPHFMEPMPLPAAVSDLIMLTKQGIDDMQGVNESMFGKQSREQSGFSMQYATSQGNMIRQRVFNKYRIFVEDIYKGLLSLCKKHWTERRTIHVLGKEKAFEAFDLSGADIDGGYDLVLEYGNSLSIDPAARREEIITLLPLFKEAGVNTRTILSMLKLNELEGALDLVTLAADRQREVFQVMIQEDIYIPPRELQDHKNMLDYAYGYLMSAEYQYVSEPSKKLIERHVREREQLAVKPASAAAAAAANPSPGEAMALGAPASAPLPTPIPAAPGV